MCVRVCVCVCLFFFVSWLECRVFYYFWLVNIGIKRLLQRVQRLLFSLSRLYLPPSSNSLFRGCHFTPSPPSQVAVVVVWWISCYFFCCCWYGHVCVALLALLLLLLLDWKFVLTWIGWMGCCFGMSFVFFLCYKNKQQNDCYF